jgi:LisH domain-containing protein ARMC9
LQEVTISPFSANCLSRLILEYFQFSEFSKTAEAFQNEIKHPSTVKSGANKEGSNKGVVNGLNRKFSKTLDEGDYDTAMRLWNKYIPQAVRNRDPTCQKLYFNLQLHFAIFPLLPAGKKSPNADPEQSMGRFKKFLETSGAGLAKSPQFLPYYALPFIPDPKQHPTFKEMFQPQWLNDLKARLARFFQLSVQVTEKPRLIKMLEGTEWRNGAGDGAAGDRERAAAAQAQEEAVNSKMAALKSLEAQLVEKESHLLAVKQENAGTLLEMEENCRALFDIASQCIHALIAASDGIRISEDFMKEAYSKLAALEPSLVSPSGGREGAAGFVHRAYEEPTAGFGPEAVEEERRQRQVSQSPARGGILKNANARNDYESGREGSPGSFSQDDASGRGTSFADHSQHLPHKSSPHQSSPQSSPDGSQVYGARAMSVPVLPPMDYASIREGLSTKNGVPLCRLLQALRWRYVHAHPGRQRRGVMQSYVQHDLLGQEEMVEGRVHHLPLLLAHSDSRVVEYAVRLVNALASESAGRTYLLSRPGLIEQIIKVIRGQSSDCELRKNALGALQKFSLRRRAQSEMIRHDLLAWLTSTLADVESLSDYSVEYGSALLMNLTLRKEGKLRCDSQAKEVLAVLNDLLENENMQVRTYVHGALYSLLTRPLLKENAMAMGLEDILTALIGHSEPALARQIEYIIEQLKAEPKEDEEEEDGTEAEDTEADVEDGDEDLVDDEDELPESLSAQDPGPEGESLLASYYLAKNTRGAQGGRSDVNHSHVRLGVSKLNVTDSETPISRAVTPRSSHPMASHRERTLNRTPGRAPASPEVSESESGVYSAQVTAREGESVDPQGEDPPGSPGKSHARLPPPNPETQPQEYQEYVTAFGARPKVPRTPQGNEFVEKDFGEAAPPKERADPPPGRRPVQPKQLKKGKPPTMPQKGEVN